MSDRSPNLDLPYLLAAQAQKHVTHNEAIELLDAIVHLSVESFGATIPPANPVAGTRFALGSGASGDWSGKSGKVACWLGGGWVFLTPVIGWVAWGRADGALRVWQGTDWVEISPKTVSQLGINASADSTNRLTLAAPASLFTNEGAGHQLKINKAATEDTASVLFQSGWSGHAEFGLAGSNNFSVKVSPDGSSWLTALEVDAATGLVSGSAVQQNASDFTVGRLMRTDFGYGKGNVVGPLSQSAGVPTGAVIERGETADGSFTRWADGTQICWGSSDYTVLGIDTGSGGAFRSAVFTRGFAMPFLAAPVVSLTTMVSGGDVDASTVLAAVGVGSFDAYHVKTASGTAQSRTVQFVATGRWF